MKLGASMQFTRRQRKLISEAKEIAAVTKTNFADFDEDIDPDYLSVHLKLAIRNMVIAHVITRYTLMDEILSDVVAKYFFTVPKKKLHFGKLWRTKKFRIFVHHMLDEMYLMKKADIVHAIKPIPRDVRDHLNKLNALRNALAHSFFPENRRENRKTKKVLYAGVDIFTYEGIERFEDDWHPAFTKLAKRVYIGWKDTWTGWAGSETQDGPTH
jgi:hypothetical protein